MAVGGCGNAAARRRRAARLPAAAAEHGAPDVEPEFLDAVLAAPGLADEVAALPQEMRKHAFVVVTFVPHVEPGTDFMSVSMQVAVQTHQPEFWSQASKDVRELTANIEGHDPAKEIVVCVTDTGAFNHGFLMRSAVRPYPPPPNTSMLNYKREAPPGHPLSTILDQRGYKEAIARSKIDQDGQRRFVRLDFRPVVLPQGGHGVAPGLSAWPMDTVVSGLQESDKEFRDDLLHALKTYNPGKEAVVVINDNGLAHNKGPLTLLEVISIEGLKDAK